MDIAKAAAPKARTSEEYRLALDADGLSAFLESEFPEIHAGGKIYHVEAVAPGMARLRMDFHPRQLRPGGTISGPAMFALADLALYGAILAHIGPVALAVTTTMTINFLRKPPPAALTGECRLLRLGSRIAVGEVFIRGEGCDGPVAHATGSYSIPPDRARDTVS